MFYIPILVLLVLTFIFSQKSEKFFIEFFLFFIWLVTQYLVGMDVSWITFIDLGKHK